ncbi:MAG TPA: hypothetical protein VFY43_07170 [Candidatus Limnocylindria bacterium]|nr:hypothetical protein [Candidatus Limnocylindria bacterium]
MTQEYSTQTMRDTTDPDPIAGTYDPTTSQADQHPLAEAGQQAGQTAGHLAERAADLGLEQADHGRHLAAEGIETVARSIRRLSTEIAQDQPAIASAATTVADQAERTAQFLNDTDAREMISKVEEAARRQPLLFLGGAFVLGVATARFLKAAGPGHAKQSGLTAPAGGYQATGPGSRVGGS